MDLFILVKAFSTGSRKIPTHSNNISSIVESRHFLTNIITKCFVTNAIHRQLPSAIRKKSDSRNKCSVLT